MTDQFYAAALAEVRACSVVYYADNIDLIYYLFEKILHYRYVYVAVETLLELWFELTVLSSLEVVHKKHWVSGIVATSMLVSHWLYFIAGGLGLYFEKSDTAQSDDPALRRLKTVRNLNAFGDLDEHLDDEKSEART